MNTVTFYETIKSRLVLISAKKSKTILDENNLNSSSIVNKSLKVDVDQKQKKQLSTSSLIDISVSIIVIKDNNDSKGNESIRRVGDYENATYEKGTSIDINSSAKLLMKSLLKTSVVYCNQDNQYHIVFLLQLSSNSMCIGYLDDSIDLESSEFRLLSDPFDWILPNDNNKKQSTIIILDGPIIVTYNQHSNEIYTFKLKSDNKKIIKNRFILPFSSDDIQIYTVYSNNNNNDDNEDIYVIYLVISSKSVYISSLIVENIRIDNSKELLSNNNEISTIIRYPYNDNDSIYAMSTEKSIIIRNTINNNLISIPITSTPTKFFLLNLPYEFQNEEDKDDENYIWSQGVVIIYFSDKDMVQVYSLANKKLLNEFEKIKDIWHHDFFHYGNDQLLIRHSQTKSVCLSLVPFYKTQSFNSSSNQLNNGGDNSSEENSTFSMDLIYESLESRCKQAHLELAQLETLAKSKENLLEHSLRVLDTFGSVNSNFDTQTAPLKERRLWPSDPSMKMVSLLGNQINSNNNHSTSTTPLQSIRLVRSEKSIKNNILYSLFTFKTSKIDEYIILSIYLSNRNVKIDSISHYTIGSIYNRNGWRVKNGEETTIHLETTLPIGFDPTAVIDLFIEWRINNKSTTTTTTSLTTKQQTIHLSLLESFTLENEFSKIYKFVKNNNDSNSISESLIQYPIELNFIIVDFGKTNKTMTLKYIDDLLKTLFEGIKFSNENKSNTSCYRFSNISDSPMMIKFIEKRNFLNMSLQGFNISMLLNFISQFKSNLSNGVYLLLSFQSEWYKSLTNDLYECLSEEIKQMNEKGSIIVENKLTLNRKDQKDQYNQYYQFYSSITSLMSETEGLLSIISQLDSFWVNSFQK